MESFRCLPTLFSDYSRKALWLESEFVSPCALPILSFARYPCPGVLPWRCVLDPRSRSPVRDKGEAAPTPAQDSQRFASLHPIQKGFETSVVGLPRRFGGCRDKPVWQSNFSETEKGNRLTERCHDNYFRLSWTLAGHKARRKDDPTIVSGEQK